MALNYAAGATLYKKFTTRDANVPATLSGSPVVKVYKDDATSTEENTGVTLTVDFDGITGFNHITIDTSADATFYANGHHYAVTITTGTVGGSSVIGETVWEFDLVAASTSAPTAAAVATAIFTDLLASSDFSTSSSFGKLIKDNLDAVVSAIKAKTDLIPASPASTTNITAGTITTTTNLTNLPAAPTDWLTAAAVKADAVTKIQSGLSTYAGGAVASVTGNVGGMTAAGLAMFFTTDSTKTFTDAVNGSVVKEIASNASGGGSGLTAADVWTYGTRTLSALSTDLITAASVSSAAVTKIQAGLSTYSGGAVASVTGNVGGNITGSVGSVLGNVGGNVVGTVGGMTAAGLAMFFTVDTTKVFADAIGGSVIKETATGTGSDPWAVAVPGSYLAGTAGYILGNRLDATITSRSTYSGTDTPGILTLLSRIGGAITINEGGVAIDWANVVNPGATVNLANTTISPSQVIASVSGNVGGNVTGTTGGMTAAGMARFFTVDTTKVYADAVAGSVVHETASNSSGGGSGLTAADVWAYATRTLTSLGSTAPAGWIDAASIAAGALNGKGDWSTYAGGDTAGVTTLLSRIGSTITIAGGGVNVNLAQTLSSARALDTIADTSLTFNDALHCSIATAAGQRVEDKNALTYVQKTPFTATVLRTFSIDSAAAPTRRT